MRQRAATISTAGLGELIGASELACDAIEQHLWMGFRDWARRRTAPWEFADRNPFPEFEPFPMATPVVRRVRTAVRDVIFRLHCSVNVLRHGYPLDDWCDE